MPDPVEGAVQGGAAGSAFGPYGSLIGAGIGALGSYFGQSSANDTNMRLAAENRQWQTDMSNTAHQREVRDLIAAGLNPILSVNRSGAGTPNVPAAVLQSTMSHATNSAHDYFRNEQSRQEALNLAQQRRIKAPLETGAGLVDSGIQSTAAAVKAATSSAVETVLEHVQPVQSAVAKVAESVSGSVASSVDTIKEVAAKAGVAIGEVIAAPGKFISGVVNSASDAERIDSPTDTRKYRFKGSYDSILSEIKRIRDPDDRRGALKQFYQQKTYVK